MDVIERLKHCLTTQGKVRGARGPSGSKPLVEVTAAEVLAACALVRESERDEVVRALHQGSSAGRPERRVYIQADDLYHLLDRAQP